MSYCFDRCPDRSATESSKWRKVPGGVIPLWLADMDFTCPPEVIQALHERVDHGIFGYGMPLPEVYEAVVDFVYEAHGWKIEPEWVVFVPGVVTGFNLAVEATCRPGDAMLVQPPVYPPILCAPADRRLAARWAPLVDNGSGRCEVDFDRFEQAMAPETAYFLLCNPHNPVGRVFERAELERMAEICLRHNTLILSDEIHSDIVYSGHRHIPIASLDPEVAARTFTFIAPSKTFNIAGLKCSVAIIPDRELRERFEVGRRGLVDSVNVMGLTAAMAAYRSGMPWLRELLVYLEGNRDCLARFVAEELPGVRMNLPEGTFLAWLDFRQAGLPENASAYLEKNGVALNDGNSFGDTSGGFVRLNFGCPRDTLMEALLRIKRALAQLG